MELISLRTRQDIENQFIKLDEYFDYIPFVSTVANIVNIFQKCVVIPFLDHVSQVNHNYYSYLNCKSFSRCFILLIPIIGNICIALSDLMHRARAIANFANRLFNGETIEEIFSDELGYNPPPEFNLERMDNKAYVLERIRMASPPNYHLAVQAIIYASDELKNDRDVVTAAVRLNFHAFDYAGPQLQGDSDFVLNIVNNYIDLTKRVQLMNIFDYCTDELKDDRAFVSALMQKDPNILGLASDRVKRELGWVG